MKLKWVMRVSLNPVTGTKKKFGNRNTWRRPCEDGGLCDALQTKEFQRLPANPPRLGRGKKGFSYSFQKEHGPDNTIIPEPRDNRFLLFWGTQFMYLVTAALGIYMMSQSERSIIHLSNERVIEPQKVKGENGLRQTCNTGYRFFFFCLMESNWCNSIREGE